MAQLHRTAGESQENNIGSIMNLSGRVFKPWKALSLGASAALVIGGVSVMGLSISQAAPGPVATIAIPDAANSPDTQSSGPILAGSTSVYYVNLRAYNGKSATPGGDVPAPTGPRRGWSHLGRAAVGRL